MGKGKAKSVDTGQQRWSALAGDIDSILRADHGDPFVVLGPHPALSGRGIEVRVFLPGADEVAIVDAGDGATVALAERVRDEGFFIACLPDHKLPFAYRIQVRYPLAELNFADAYSFGSLMGELDIHLLAEGSHRRSYERLGAHPRVVDGVEGVNFAVWAPNARRVSVVGDFCEWDGRRLPMRKWLDIGIWDIFVPGVQRGNRYKFEIAGPDGVVQPLKSDPFAFRGEVRPANASVVEGLDDDFRWPGDANWWQARKTANGHDAPISIYEVHLGSWARVPEEGNRFLSYDELAERLVPYVRDLGFTHIELLPITEHPFDGSWGYQPIGLYAPTSRFGTPDGFKRFVAACHAAGIGVLLDWVPGHFPTDAHGLARFDGTHLYEHADPRQGFHQDWNTLIYNFGRTEVAGYLLNNALFWLDRYRLDGLRVDAVASMLYRDYSRKDGEWIANEHGGRENLEAVSLLRRMNQLTYGERAEIMTVAEESTAWPAVSRPVEAGGLGFGFKWNMGWMHDTLAYMASDPIHRRHHHDKLTFGLLYQFSENFVLPLSHDEVVHGKGSLINKMPGDIWQKFANLRAYYGFMFAHPGKKLLFMGAEFGQWQEWSEERSLDWHLMQDARHSGLRDLVRDLNHAYRRLPALHRTDCDPAGFEWLVTDDRDQSVIAFLRRDHDGGGTPVVAISNFTPVPRHQYRIGVPLAGPWRVVINTDEARYYGSGQVQPLCDGADSMLAEPVPSHGQPFSLSLNLPPLASLMLEC